MTKDVLVAVEMFLALKADNTQRQYRMLLREFNEFLNGIPLAKVKEINALGFINSQKVRNISPPSVRRKIVILSGVYDFLVRQKLAADNPFTYILDTLPRAPTGYIRPHSLIPFEKVKEILTAPNCDTPVGKRDSAILSLLFGGALRISEVCALKIQDLKTSDKGTLVIQLTRTKAQRAQKAVLPDWAAQNIFSYLRHRQLEGARSDAYLFPMYTPDGFVRGHLLPRQLRRIFKQYAEKVGLPQNVTVHSARATAITKLLSDGLDYRTVQEFSRHSSVQMVEKYDKRRFEIEEHPGKKVVY